MALMKAKTANAKASSVDKVAQAIEYIAKDISYAVNHGDFSTEVAVGIEQAAAVRDALQKAGYSVMSPVLRGIPAAEPSWWEKIFITQFKRMEVFCDEDPPYSIFNISWRVIRETKKA